MLPFYRPELLEVGRFRAFAVGDCNLPVYPSNGGAFEQSKDLPLW